MKPLGRIVSGGELSRIMLAIKAILADRDQIETLIFDEIDTGISGRTAQKVSEKMAVIGSCHQVLCITHLPQIAAMADTHFEIEKHQKGSETITEIHPLGEGNRFVSLPDFWAERRSRRPFSKMQWKWKNWHKYIKIQE